MSLRTILQSVASLPAGSLEKIQAVTTALVLPRGHLLLGTDKTARYIYFINRGIVRAFVPDESNGITFWFGREGDVILSMRSYVYGQPGYEYIELLEECELFQISSAVLQSLYETDIHIANFGRRLAEQELIRTEERLISRQFKTATERYRELLAHNPDLLQRVSLGHIASYLGITQVSLSRIRRGNGQ